MKYTNWTLIGNVRLSDAFRIIVLNLLVSQRVIRRHDIREFGIWHITLDILQILVCTNIVFCAPSYITMHQTCCLSHHRSLPVNTLLNTSFAFSLNYIFKSSVIYAGVRCWPYWNDSTCIKKLYLVSNDGITLG